VKFANGDRRVSLGSMESRNLGAGYGRKARPSRISVECLLLTDLLTGWGAGLDAGPWKYIWALGYPASMWLSWLGAGTGARLWSVVANTLAKPAVRRMNTVSILWNQLAIWCVAT